MNGSPVNLAADSAGHIYVLSNSERPLGTNMVEKRSTADGSLIARWGSSGSGDGQFYLPRGIATDPAGNVYVTDSGAPDGSGVAPSVQKFTSTGSFLAKWGSRGSGDGEFLNPTAIATDPSGNVYVVDVGTDRVQKFTSDGAFLTAWGSTGTGDGQFNGVGDIAVTPTGEVFVSDGGNNRIQRFASDGTFIAKWGSDARRGGEFRPGGIESDPDGNIFVVDRSFPSSFPSYVPAGQIQKFTSSGALLDVLECTAPTITTDPAGNLYALHVSTGRYGQVESASITRYGDPGRPPDCVYQVDAGPLRDNGFVQELRTLKLSIICVFADCEASASGSVRVGKVKAKLRRTKLSIPEDAITDLRLRIKGKRDRRAIRRALEDEGGRATVRLKVTEVAGRTERDTISIKLDRTRSPSRDLAAAP